MSRSKHKEELNSDLNAYRQNTADQPSKPIGHPKRVHRHHMLGLKLFAVIALAVLVFFAWPASGIHSIPRPIVKPTPTSKKAVVATPQVVTTECTGNTLSEVVIVSISERHLWACDASTVAYDSPVVTGMEMYPADLTPPGTYHVYAKETDLTLKGCDTTGCWNDFVNYWMPWLDNQYGQYGFHDATWRPANAFGNISPDSTDASHGCVELPLATAKWLFNWVQIGTTVTIQA
jgi:hypothetical protein